MDETVVNSEKPAEEIRPPEKVKTEISAREKICGVCGDKALGYNFNAISCESCKAFFRRNALASKDFKCPFTNSCEITVITRRFCQKCRLEKCFSIGMVKEFIMSDQDKAEKRKKIEENRAKKRSYNDCDNSVSSSKQPKREPIEAIPSHKTIDAASPVIQYDVLSTTCSPNSSFNSPMTAHEVDSSNISFETHISDTTTHLDTTQSLDTPTQSYTTPSQNYDATTQGYDTQNIEGGHGYAPYNYQPQYDPYHRKYVESKPFDSGSHYVVYEAQKSGESIRSILSTGEGLVYQQEETSENVPSSSDHTMDKARDILEDVERMPIEPNSIESILCEAIKLEFEAYSSVSACGRSSRELNDAERAKLNELIVANKALHVPIDEDISINGLLQGAAGLEDDNDKHDPQLLTIINLTAIAIRRLIKMAKKINAFKNMCEEDQVALLKGGCTEMMVLRGTITYDGQRNSWKIPHSQEELRSIKTDVLKLAKGNIYQAHDSFIRTFEPRWRQDENIILIMSAILLFTPHRPRVVHTDVIRLEQNSYYYLLRRYLESVYTGCEAKSVFLKLIQKISELHRLADEMISVYLDVNPIEPLLMEIFDLKHHAA